MYETREYQQVSYILVLRFENNDRSSGGREGEGGARSTRIETRIVHGNVPLVFLLPTCRLIYSVARPSYRPRFPPPVPPPLD